MQWAEIGVHVFPVAGDKRPVLDPETERRYAWGEKASADEEAIAEMPWDDAQYIGLYLGKSNKVGVDVDWLYSKVDGVKVPRPKDDPEACERWENAIESLDRLGIQVFGNMSQKTPGQGRHKIFQGNGTAIPLKDAWFPGVDLKAGKSYIVDYGGFNTLDPIDPWPYPKVVSEKKAATNLDVFPKNKIKVSERGEAWLKYMGQARSLGMVDFELEALSEAWVRLFCQDPDEFLTTEDYHERLRSTYKWESPVAEKRIKGMYVPPGPVRVILKKASDLPMKITKWLWHEWMPRGMLTLMAGPSKHGKTTAALSMAAAVSSGGKWPDGSPAPAGDVLIWTGEDLLAETIKPRLAAMGADMDRVHFICDAVEDADGEKVTRKFDPARDMPELAAAARELDNPLLTIVDSLASAVDGDAHRNNEVRRGLQPVVELAEELEMCVLGVVHFNKNSKGSRGLDRINGSLAWAALARMTFYVSKRTDSDERMMVRGENNIAPTGDGFLYKSQRVAVTEEIHAQKVVWGAKLIGDPDVLLSDAEQDPEARRPLDEAKDFIQSYMDQGPAPAAALELAAEKAGINHNTLQKAKKRLGIESKKIGARWEWVKIPPKIP
jgi:putative DNA primase/helicase